MFVKCFDVANMVISVATKQLDGYHIDKGLLKSFSEICTKIDNFAQGTETSGCNKSYGYDVDVDIKTQEIIVGITFDMCEFQETDPMYSVMQTANDIKIEGFQENVDYDMDAAVRMVFRFPGVWRINE